MQHFALIVLALAFSLPSAFAREARDCTFELSKWEMDKNSQPLTDALKACEARRNVEREAAAADAAEKRERDKQEYVRAYEAANTLILISSFEYRYRYNDPENLIPRLEPLKRQLEAKQYQDRFADAISSSDLQSFISAHELNDPDTLVPEAKRRLEVALKTERAKQYQDRFAAAKSSAELQSFIAAYGENDPDSLVPQAQKLLATVLKIEEAKQIKADRERAETGKRLEIERLATPIANCNQLTTAAYKAIQREKEIAAVSGYENKQILRQAGEYIVTCRNMVPRAYEVYRKAGGTKGLNELR
jgi:hypothetical protein